MSSQCEERQLFDELTLFEKPHLAANDSEYHATSVNNDIDCCFLRPGNAG